MNKSSVHFAIQSPCSRQRMIQMLSMFVGFWKEYVLIVLVDRLNKIISLSSIPPCRDIGKSDCHAKARKASHPFITT
jgi:hypothetical protein